MPSCILTLFLNIALPEVSVVIKNISPSSVATGRLPPSLITVSIYFFTSFAHCSGLLLFITCLLALTKFLPFGKLTILYLTSPSLLTSFPTLLSAFLTDLLASSQAFSQTLAILSASEYFFIPRTSKISLAIPLIFSASVRSCIAVSRANFSFPI